MVNVVQVQVAGVDDVNNIRILKASKAAPSGLASINTNRFRPRTRKSITIVLIHYDSPRELGVGSTRRGLKKKNSDAQFDDAVIPVN